MLDQPPLRRSCTKKVAIGFWAVVLVLSILCYDFNEVSREVHRMLATDDEKHDDLPPIYWINLDRSTERKDSMTEMFSSLGISDSDTHRVSASNVETTTQMLQEGRLNFHRWVTIENIEGPTFKKHLRNTYDYKEAACLLSHLDAIKQAYDDGHELALILEDDAKITHKFQREWSEYVTKGAPPGWKVLQMATINPRVMKQGVNLIDRFISWQPWHWSTRAYLINRSGMETLMQKSHSLTETGETIWRIDEMPMVVADEVIYQNIGDSYTTTSLWVDSMELPSTVGNDFDSSSVLQDSYAPYISMEKAKEENFDRVSEKSLLVVTRATFSSESSIVESMRRIEEDYHAACRFHEGCAWEVDVALTNPALSVTYDKISSELESKINIHFHAAITSEQSSDISHLRKHAARMGGFDLVLIKNLKQRIVGLPWQSFLEKKGNAVLAGPLRQKSSDAMLTNINQDNSRDKSFKFHEARSWQSGSSWSKELFMNIKPTEVPMLGRYFVLVDAKFASDYFETHGDSLSDEASELFWCQAAKTWDPSRQGCHLIPFPSKDESGQDEHNDIPVESSRTMVETPFAEMIKCSMEWKEVIEYAGITNIRRKCHELARTGEAKVFELQKCASHFYSDRCRPSTEAIV